MTNDLQTETLSDLASRWAELKREQPKLRIRDAAIQLGVSEMELVMTTVDGESTVRLDGEWSEVLPSLGALGYVMALTRNHAAVHERKGVYENMSFSGHIGLAVNPDIDLRLFMHAWKHAYAVSAPGPRGTMRSIQFFDGAGTALHKVFLTEGSNEEAYSELVARWRAAEQHPQLQLEAAKQRPQDLGDSEIDGPALLEDWKNLKDTHDFFPMLKKHKAGRVQALRFAEGTFSTRVADDFVVRMLNRGSENDVEIMVFVGNHGCIQIHSGPAKRIVPMDPWINILDPKFNLHLRLDKIASSWLVYKPTEDGLVSALELYDADGQQIAQFFGKRKPGIPELEMWREALKTVEASYHA